MPRANPIKPAFNAGELSPRMEARVDYRKYENGCATLCNMTPLVQGGVMRRPGTRYVAETKNSSAKPRLLRFEFSTAQAYVIEAGNLYFRFFKDQGRITADDITASITGDDSTFTSGLGSWSDESGAGSSVAHDSTNDRMSLISNGTTDAHAQLTVTNAAVLNHSLQFQVIGAPGDKVKLRIGTSSKGTEIVNDLEFEVGYHVYTFTSTAADFHVQFLHDTAKTLQIDNVVLLDDAALELVTPYATSQLFTLKSAQSADVMYIAHPSHPVHKLTRTGHTNWSLTEVAWQDGPYLDRNTTETTLQAAAATGNGVNVTASATTGINGGDGFKSTDVGRVLRIDDDSAEPGWGVIVAVSSTTVAVLDIKRDLVTTAEKGWSLGAWSVATGYPVTVGFFEQRLGGAQTSTQPQSFWLSQSADLENMRPDSFDSGVMVEDDDALAYTFAASEVNAIRWISGGKQLALGTSAGVWIAESDGAILTPNDIQCRRHTTNGSADIAPARVDDVVVYVQRAKRKINEFAYNFESDGYQSPDMTILADHITASGVVEMAYQEEPHSIMWCVREDGVLAAMTYRRGEDVVGWARHEIGGTFNTAHAVAESVVAIPGNVATGSDDRDETWVVVKRTVNGVTKRYVEFLEGDFEGPVRHDYASDALHDTAMIEAQKDAFYVDCGLTLDNPATISSATQADPVVITISDNHGFSDGDEVEISGVLGMTEFNGNSYKVENEDKNGSNTFELTAIDDMEEGTFDVAASASEEWGDAVANSKHVGLLFANTNSGDVQQVRIRTSDTHTTDANAVAGIYADSSGNPGAQVGGDSDTVAVNAARTVFTFTWSANIPTLSAATNYWLVISNSDASGNSTLETVADQGSGFASGKADTVAAISDGSNGFIGDLVAEIAVSNNIDGTAFTAYVSDEEERGKARKKVTSITGLDHLEGETVKVLADGAVHPDKTVSSGAITLDYKAGRVQCGLGYTHKFRSLKLTAGAAAGTAIGKIKRVHRVGLVLKDAAATQIGPSDGALQNVIFREVGDAMDTAVPLFTGEKMAGFDADYDRDQRIVIQNDAPAPFTLLALAPEMKTNEQA